MDEIRVFVKRVLRSGTVLGIRLGMLRPCIQGQLCNKWMKILFSWRESHVLGQFWVYGRGCWNPTFKASHVSNGRRWRRMLKSCTRPVIYQIDEIHVFMKRIMCSGTVLGIRLWMLKSCIQGQLCIKWVKSCFRGEIHTSWDSSGHTAEDVEIPHSRQVMYQIDNMFS